MLRKVFISMLWLLVAFSDLLSAPRDNQVRGDEAKTLSVSGRITEAGSGDPVIGAVVFQWPVAVATGFTHLIV